MFITAIIDGEKVGQESSNFQEDSQVEVCKNLLRRRLTEDFRRTIEFEAQYRDGAFYVVAFIDGEEVDHEKFTPLITSRQVTHFRFEKPGKAAGFQSI